MRSKFKLKSRTHMCSRDYVRRSDRHDVKFQTVSLFVNEGLPVRLSQPTGLPVDRCACWRHSCGQKRAEIVLDTHSTRAVVGSVRMKQWGCPHRLHGPHRIAVCPCRNMGTACIECSFLVGRDMEAALPLAEHRTVDWWLFTRATKPEARKHRVYHWSGSDDRLCRVES